jgi:NAD(P)-dependent dehydrogenase (short-subunit alcohol dehydrogenase family)
MASKDAQVVVITGASAGVGRAVARRFADEGASIALIARGRERLGAAAGEQTGQPVRAPSGRFRGPRSIRRPLEVPQRPALDDDASSLAGRRRRRCRSDGLAGAD